MGLRVGLSGCYNGAGYLAWGKMQLAVVTLKRASVNGTVQKIAP
jgi:hypothetical protein